jgi:hypothetical protein
VYAHHSSALFEKFTSKMNQKLIFADVDGVLNGSLWAGHRPHRSLLPPACADYAFEEQRLDPSCIARLREVVNELDASIVISSTWRRRMAVAEFIKLFSLYGYENAPIIGATPEVGDPHNSITRGTEIAAWLEANAARSTRYVCLDDDADYLPGQPLVQTDVHLGLQDVDVAACRETLADRVSGEKRLLVRSDLLKGAHVRRWPSGRRK